MRYNGNTFVGQQVRLDNNEYIGCTFTDCEFVFSGTGRFVLLHSTITNPRIVFDGPASLTLQTLRDLYHGGAKEIIERTLQEIRTPPRPPGR